MSHSPNRFRHILAAAAMAFACANVWAEQRFPPPQFESDYHMPTMTEPAPRAEWAERADVAVLFGALCVATWLALGRRSRAGMVGLSVFSLAYFGFYRGGCVCPIGAIQDVALALADPTYAVPFTVVLFFALPLVFALLFGRVFCGGVCPLGAMQDLALIKPVRVPSWLDAGLRVLPFAYLGAAVLYAATDTQFIICRWDPFVAFFRLSGTLQMLVIGAVFLLLSAFIGRPYCRFLCPYGALLGMVSRWSWRQVSITPDKCIECSLCDGACPFGAIRRPTPEGVADEP